MQTWWKNPKVTGTAAYLLTSFLSMTMRLKVHKHSSITATKPYLFAFWHGKQFLPALMLNKLHHTPSCAMVSPSRDGAILAVMLGKLGYTVTRGSSRDGGLRALLAMKKSLTQGSSVGFGIDGPIGPLYKVKPGMVFLAQKSQIKIIPVGSAFSRYWIFDKAWDKFQLPKPFCKAVLVLGEPFIVHDKDNIEAACVKLEKLLQKAEQEARALI
jgi:lysophospholipid acyltransferase (LPLAT)-like uncharacterized protein